MDPAVVKDLVDHMMTDAPISTEPTQASATNGKGKRKASAAKDQTTEADNIMELTFQLKNMESFLTYVGTLDGPDGKLKYIYKKLDKKSKVDPSVQMDPSAQQSAADPPAQQSAADPSAQQAAADLSAQQADPPVSSDPTATQTVIPSTTVSSTTPTTQTVDPSGDSNTEEIDVAQYIEDFKKKMMENMDDNELLQIMCHNFFCILTNIVAKKPISGSLGGKLNAIQVMANAMRAKDDTQTDKEALLSYINTRCSAKNYLRKALMMKEDNTKSVEDLLDMFMVKLKK